MASWKLLIIPIHEDFATNSTRMTMQTEVYAFWEWSLCVIPPLHRVTFSRFLRSSLLGDLLLLILNNLFSFSRHRYSFFWMTDSLPETERILVYSGKRIVVSSPWYSKGHIGSYEYRSVTNQKCVCVDGWINGRFLTPLWVHHSFPPNWFLFHFLSVCVENRSITYHGSTKEIFCWTCERWTHWRIWTMLHP